MNDEQDNNDNQPKEVEPKKVSGVPVLPCGHEISFEHELADLMYTIMEGCQANPKLDYMATAMNAIREVFAYCYLTIPSYDELIKIKLAHSMEDLSKEVN